MDAIQNMSSRNHSVNKTFELDYDWHAFLLNTICTPRDSYILRMVIFASFALFGFVGNVSLLVVILKDKHLRNSPNILICNLAFADLLYIVVVGPLRIEHEINPCWFLGTRACALKNYAPVVCQCTCVYSLVALSRERYSAIVSGIHTHMSKQVKITVGWVLSTWIFGVIFAAPILSSQFSRLSMGGFSCMSFTHGSLNAKIYEIIRMFVLYLIPLTIISIHYVTMARGLIQSTKRFEKNTTTQFIKQVNSRKRLAYLSITLSIFFGLFWLPNYIYNLKYQFTSKDELNAAGDTFRKFRLFNYYMSLANSSLNPWLVFIMSSSHRNKLRSCMTCKMAKVITSFRARAVETTATYAMSTVTVVSRSLKTRDDTGKM